MIAVQYVVFVRPHTIRDGFAARELTLGFHVHVHVFEGHERGIDYDGNRQLLGRVVEHLVGRELFAQDLYCGADPDYRLPIRVVSEYAWHSLFVRQLFVRPEAGGAGDACAGVYRDCRAGVRGRAGA